MRQTVSFRAFFAGLVHRARVVVLAAFLWGVVFADAASAPPPWPAMAPQSLTLHDELTQAFVERAGQVAGVSRSEPAEPPSPPVVWPAAGALTGWFGERRGGHSHPGIDVDGSTGDPVVAAAAGVVTHAGPSPAGYAGYGTMVLVAHEDGLATIYAHLSRVAVRAGQVVKAGEHLGAVGTTGNVTGSHLHFELRKGGSAVDPRRWLPAR